MLEPVVTPVPSRPEDAGTVDQVDPMHDTRVTAVLAVLRGATLEEAARRAAVEPMLLQRWVAAFVSAGIATVVNRPDPLVALQRDRLLAAVTAEIRQPLVTAQEAAQRLTERVSEPHTMVAQAGLVASALNQLTERVADAEVLVAAAIGGIEIQRTAISTGSLLSRLPSVGTVHGKGPDYEVDVDPDLFARVLRDVWEAAGRWPRPRYRRMYVRVVGPWVEFRVLRQGDPINEDVLHALFEPFGSDDPHSGVTMGLYLARTLTVAHGGTLGVEQDESGAAFWVRVPARVAPALPSSLRRRIPMTFKLACGDVMPGCGARFEDTDRNGLLGQIAAHAAADHGITDITPEILALVESKISAA